MQIQTQRVFSHNACLVTMRIQSQRVFSHNANSVTTRVQSHLERVRATLCETYGGAIVRVRSDE